MQENVIKDYIAWKEKQQKKIGLNSYSTATCHSLLAVNLGEHSSAPCMFCIYVKDFYHVM